MPRAFQVSRPTVAPGPDGRQKISTTAMGAAGMVRNIVEETRAGDRSQVTEADEGRQFYQLHPAKRIVVMAADTIRTLLEAAFPGGQVDVLDRTGGGDHFHVTVASDAFDGVSLVEQHRMVNRALAAPLADGTIHELRITTTKGPA